MITDHRVELDEAHRLPRGVALIYPVRKRCIRCRKFFGFLILAGLWCSYECAGHPVPSPDPADWPRGHFVPYGWGRRRAKKVFDDEAEALAYPGRQGKNAYLCDYCLMWHIGTTRVEEREMNKQVRGRVEVPPEEVRRDHTNALREDWARSRVAAAGKSWSTHLAKFDGTVVPR